MERSPSVHVSLGVILSSATAGRTGQAIAMWLIDLLGRRPHTSISLLDLRDYPLPSCAQRGVGAARSTDATARCWSEQIKRLDGFIVVASNAPDASSDQLRNALGPIATEWEHKPIGFATYGGTSEGGSGTERLRQAALDLRMLPLRAAISVRPTDLAADEQGRPSDPHVREAGMALSNELLRWSHFLKDYRRGHPAMP